MKLRDDLILQFEDKDFVGCRLNEGALLDWANDILYNEMRKWPLMEKRNDVSLPPYLRVRTRIMPEQHDTPESILKEIIEWSDRNGIVEYKGKPPTLNNLNYFLNKAKKLLGKL